MNEEYWVPVKKIYPISPPVHPSESIGGQAQPASSIGLFLVQVFDTKLKLDKDL